ncbi:hypothetical protein Bbelb_377660 [Branchiostoma belcheri]|nr:hypothetical protein Bbelb_377660 [Branchiostoma belcheri]
MCHGANRLKRSAQMFFDMRQLDSGRYFPSRGLGFEGGRIVPCKARCKSLRDAYHTKLHYHCHMCPATIIRKCDYVTHLLKAHKINQQPTHNHLINNHLATNRKEKCVQDCQQAMGCAARSKMPGFECPHIESTKFAERENHVQAELSEQLLQELARNKILKRETVAACLRVASHAQERSIPLVGTFAFSNSDRYIPLSIYTPSIHTYSTLGRVVVTFDRQTGNFTCPCSTLKRGCLHKAIAVWFFHQDYPDLLKQHNNQARDMQEEDTEEDTCEATLEEPTIINQNGKILDLDGMYDVVNMPKMPVAMPEASDLDADRKSMEPNKANDGVNMLSFWKQAEEEILERGFSRGKTTNPVVPSYRPWAPWIAPDTLKSTSSVYNTEYRKARKDRDARNEDADAIHKHLSKEKWKNFSKRQRPHQGRLCEPTEEAIAMAEEGDLTVTFPWYRDMDNTFHGVADHDLEDYRHPVTGEVQTAQQAGEFATPRVQTAQQAGEFATPRVQTAQQAGEFATPRVQTAQQAGEFATPRVQTAQQAGEFATPRVQTGQQAGEFATPRVQTGQQAGEFATPRVQTAQEAVCHIGL